VTLAVPVNYKPPSLIGDSGDYPGLQPGPGWRVFAHQWGDDVVGPTKPSGARAGAAFSGAFGAATAGYRVTDKGGYTYAVQPDASLVIVAAPAGAGASIGTTYRPGDPAYEIIVARLRAVDPAFEFALGPASTGTPSGADARTSFFASMLAHFGLDTPEGQAQAAEIVKTEGPQLLDAVKGLIGIQGARSLDQLLQRLAVIRAKLPQTTNAARRARLQAEAAAIQAEISRIQAMQQSAALSAASPPPRPGVPSAVWIAPAVGVLLLGGTLLYVTTRKRRK
jgi:hypothetical protein